MAALTKKERAVLNNLTLEDMASAGVATSMTRGEVIEYVNQHVLAALKDKAHELHQRLYKTIEMRFEHKNVTPKIQSIGEFLSSYNGTAVSDLLYGFRYTRHSDDRITATVLVFMRDSHTPGFDILRLDCPLEDVPQELSDLLEVNRRLDAIKTKMAEIKNGTFKYALTETLLASTDAGRAILSDIETMTTKAVESM